MTRRLHIGGHVRTSGWEVLDANPGPVADHVADARKLRFADGTFEHLYASHVVEHFDYKDELVTTLGEWGRVLTPGGLLSISVPDLDVLARLFLEPTLSLLERFTVMRMIFGGHADRHDYHLVGLNELFLTGYLRAAGFSTIKRVASFDLFEDASTLRIRGVPISLNMTARKSDAAPTATPPVR